MIPTTTPIPSVTDYVQLQDWMTMMLMCDFRLQQINAVQERKLLMDATLQIDSLWQGVRNGGAGLGIIVEDVRETISEGCGSADSPIYDLEFGFVVMEERNLNFAPGVGTMITAEQASRVIVDIFYQENIQPFGQVFARGRVGEPANDWIRANSGVYARRTSLKMKNPGLRTQRCDMVSISEAAGMVTIHCTSTAPGLQIWYTTDGSFPANSVTINAATQKYTIPFSVASETVVTAAAFAPGRNISAVKQTTII
jgi:hypothetical protein